MSKRKNAQTAKVLFKHSLKNGELNPEKISKIVSKFRQIPGQDSLDVLKMYKQLIQMRILEQTAIVEVPQKPNESLAAEIEKDIRSRFPEINDVKFIVDPDLLVGVRLQIADMVYENSFRAKLESLKEGNPEEKIMDKE